MLDAVCIAAEHLQQMKSKNSLSQGEEWIQVMNPKTDGQWSDKCTSNLENCHKAAEYSLLVGWSGIIVPDLTLTAQLYASSLPHNTSVKA